MTRIFLLSLIPYLSFANPDPGEAAYQTNCIACHQLDFTSVGPSLVNIAKVYPKEKKAEFIQWAIKPGKKNPLLIEMPSMAHMGEENLAHIHDYLLKVTKGVKHKKGKDQFQPVPEPKRDLPYVRYAFLPESSPASFAIIYEGETSACWDTEACRLRYLWKSGQTRLVTHRDVYDLPAPPFHIETSPVFWSFAAGKRPRYHGFNLIQRQPEFHYQIADVEIRELVIWKPASKTLLRRFKITNPPASFQIHLAKQGAGTFSTDKGTLDSSTLSLHAEQAREFTITLSFP
ncbi:c-type cytochrome [Luteolibacter algae]|uniref:C-type cytochrome n=1 Tax=Luteolibacter algae TaxID=454151 RepID=A0ABW5D912_9BACT